MASTNSSSLLDAVNCPADLRRLSENDLLQLSDELRKATLEAVSVTGGHLGAGLGVVELTVALHYVLDTPRDVLIWDTGHQAYPHKILTGRRAGIHTIRQAGGLSGFTKRTESIYDPFGAGHAGTAVSAALGVAEGGRLRDKDSTKVVAVIGDGALSVGMTYEALNNAGGMDSRLVVILNDNGMFISPPEGAMSAYLERLMSNKSCLSLSELEDQISRKLPWSLQKKTKHRKEFPTSSADAEGAVFEGLGFNYIGPVDGHNLEALLLVLKKLKNLQNADEGPPILLHVVTQKGQGYHPALNAPDRYHSVSKFDISTGKQCVGETFPPHYSQVFVQALISEAERDEDIVAVTAAMLSGTGLNKFHDRFPERLFDVGIAEQHAVTFSAGLVLEGLKPFCAIYSTFLQRAYDQVIHDVALQKLAVRFAIDRAGLVGADGPTHAGSFDLAYLGCIPNIVVMSPSDEQELLHMVATAVAIDDRPSGIRYPKAPCIGIESLERGKPLTVGKGRIVKEGNRVAILSIGSRMSVALEAARILDADGLSTTVADARFLKPLDMELLRSLVREHEILVTVEEGAEGGFGARVLHGLSAAGLLDRGLKLRTQTLPDAFMDHGSTSDLYSSVGLDAMGIVTTVRKAL